MNRRHLLTLAPAVLAAGANSTFGKALDPSTQTSVGFTISIQCWSFKNFTLFEAIEKAAAAGAQGVEIFEGQSLSPEQKNIKVGVNMPAESIAALLAHAKKHNITVVNFGVVDIPNNEVQARKFFEFGKALGIYGITTESLGTLDLLEKLSQEYDLKVCFHNHPKPSPLWNPDTVFNALKGRHANLGYCADLGHWPSSGLNPLDVIKKIAPLVRSFHIKDRASLTGPTHDQVLGTGLFDLAAILDEVRKHGFKGNVSIEYEHNWADSVADIAQGVGFLRGYSKSRS